MPVGNEIRCQFDRPPQALIEGFRGIPVANIDDCMSRTASIDAHIRPLNSHPLLGSAFTVKVPPGDNLMLHKAMDLAQPGDVIAIDAGSWCNRAIFGSLMAHYCAIKGIAGLIVDGAIRDLDDLKKLSIPVYARGTSPNGPYKNGPGEIGTDISLGGQVIHPGDILIGDGDGVVVVRPEQALPLQQAAASVLEKEAAILKGILEQGVYPRPWVDQKLQEIGCGVGR